MKTFFRLLALFMAMPVVELALLLQVSRWVGFWPTVALIIATAVAGSYLAKREGLSAWNRLQGSLSGGGLPGDEILDAVIVLIAGAFLITPGVLTDLIGFSGLIPLTRGWIRRLAKRRLKKAAREGRIQASFGPFGPGGAHAPGGSGSPPGAPPGPTGADASSAPGGAEIGGSPSPRGPAAQDNGASPGDPAPGNATPGNATPGNATPGNATPGNAPSGNAASDDGGRSRYLGNRGGDERDGRSQTGRSQTEP